MTTEFFKNITSGAVRVTEEQDGFHFYRFTEAEEAFYKERNADFHRKTFSTSGIKLEFETDATELFLGVDILRSSSRTYFAFDLYIDGKYTDSLKNFTEEDEKTLKYHEKAYKLGAFDKTFLLGNGKKTVKLVFPWSVEPVLKTFELKNATFINPVKKSGIILAYGDSITHGYDAMYPSKSYAELMTAAFDAEIVNKAIGGEIFCPGLSAFRADFTPDFITVAYGTNDWNHVATAQEFEKNCRGFIENLIKNYPGIRIFAFTPIWRDVTGKDDKFCKFEELDGFMQKIYADYDAITFISCRHFVPESSDFFADLTLHPNDKGFEHYAKGVISELKNHL